MAVGKFGNVVVVGIEVVVRKRLTSGLLYIGDAVSEIF